MHFDDRLATVLRLRADGPAVCRIQYRQLLDLLGTLPSEAHGDQIDAAYDRLNTLTAQLPVAERVIMISNSALRLRSPRLVACLAESDSEVAAATLSVAELSRDQWLDLIPALPIHVRGNVRQRRDLDPTVTMLLARLGVLDRGLPPATGQAANDLYAADTNNEPQPDEKEFRLGEVVTLPPTRDPDGIGAIVRRIEAFRRAREDIESHPSGDSPRLPLGEDHVLLIPQEVKAFDFATDASGQILWSDPGVAAMAVGLRLNGNHEAGTSTAPSLLEEALRRRQPLRAMALTIAGAPAIAGDWHIDAAPWFDPLTGSHLGWRGRMRRPLLRAQPDYLRPEVVPDSQADRIRQMLHELRTPVNAIQGFAEIIQQQLFGPTPHDYRALAASIAGDAARMLSAFEELERLAKLDSGALEIEPGMTDLAAVVAVTVAQLGAHTQQRNSGFVIKVDDTALLVPLAPLEVERLAWRLLATTAGVAAPGELVKLRLRKRGDTVRMDVSLPAALASRSDDELFSAAAGAIPQVLSAGVFGVGFALKLVAAEAKAAGGTFARKNDRLRLTLPGLTAANSDHSDIHPGMGAAQAPSSG